MSCARTCIPNRYRLYVGPDVIYKTDLIKIRFFNIYLIAILTYLKLKLYTSTTTYCVWIIDGKSIKVVGVQRCTRGVNHVKIKRCDKTATHVTTSSDNGRPKRLMFERLF